MVVLSAFLPLLLFPFLSLIYIFSPLHTFYYSSPFYFHLFFLFIIQALFSFFFLFTCFHTLTSLYAHVHFSLCQYFVFLSVIKSSFHLSSSSLSLSFFQSHSFISFSFSFLQQQSPTITLFFLISLQWFYFYGCFQSSRLINIYPLTSAMPTHSHNHCSAVSLFTALEAEKAVLHKRHNQVRRYTLVTSYQLYTNILVFIFKSASFYNQWQYVFTCIIKILNWCCTK